MVIRKASAYAHPIQGLIKYHGLRSMRQRVPFHDSISVSVGSLRTVTTVHFSETYPRDRVIINGKEAGFEDVYRVRKVIEPLRKLANTELRAKIASRNSVTNAKGLGFSASAFASLGLAASESLGLKIGLRELSRIVRFGAGSATRSLSGGFSVWRAEKGTLYSELLAEPEHVKLGMIIIPLPSSITTDIVHREAQTSPFFRARLAYIRKAIDRMRRYILKRQIDEICSLAEHDTLNLHAATMTSKSGIILFNPESVRVIEHVKHLREDGFRVWFSLDTGPSVFINTYLQEMPRVFETLMSEGFERVYASRPGGPAEIVDYHLF